VYFQRANKEGFTPNSISFFIAVYLPGMRVFLLVKDKKSEFAGSDG